MRVKSIVIDFNKTKRFSKESGKFSVVINLYFITIWFIDRNYLNTLKRSHDKGLEEGRKIFKN